MSIFSRKSKPSSPQNLNNKANGQPHPAGVKKNGPNANGTPNGPPVDPILQRMAIQAASRKRMNSQTPDYSIKSASTSPNLPPSHHSSSHYHSSHGRDGRRSNNSRDGHLPSGIGPDSAIAPIEAVGSARPTNKLRKSSSNMQAPSARSTDPDLQKVRMPSRELGDFGYTSIARTSTRDSKTQSQLQSPPDSNHWRRQRPDSTSFPRNEHGESRTYSVTSPPSPSVPSGVFKSRTAPSTPTKRDLPPDENGAYVSRLDPGPANSSFLTTSVVPEISKHKRSGSDRREPTSPRAAVSNSPPTNVSELPATRKPDSPRRWDEPTKPTSNMSRPRESQPRPAKFEQITKAMSPSKRSDPPRASPQTSPVQGRSTIVQRTKDQERNAPRNDGVQSESRAPAAAVVAPTVVSPQHHHNPQSPGTSAASTPYQTPRETPSTLSDSKRFSDQASSAPTAITMPSTEESSPMLAVPRDSVPLPVPSPQPQDEFPYLAGIGKGATLPDVASLAGYKVNRRGQILDEEGDIIGELISGEIVRCVRRTVNAQGEVIDDSGEVVGRAVALPRRADDDNDDTPRPNFSHEIPMSPTTLVSPLTTAPPTDFRELSTTLAKQPRVSQRANSMTERSLNNSDSAGNVVYIELDASVDSQAAPLVDQSDIFIPPYGSSAAAAQSRSKSVTNLTEIKRIADGRRSKVISPSEKNGQEERRNSKSAAGSAKQRASSDRPRSFSLMTDTAPKAVLGPTWESLLNTVPDRSQSFAQHKSVIIDGKLASQTSFKSTPPARAETMPSNIGGPSAGTARVRRTSQNNPAARNSTHQTFIKSPLSSMANTPPDTATGDAATTDASFQRQLNAAGGTGPGVGAMQTTSGGSAPSSSGQIIENDEEDSGAAPAPMIMRKTTTAGGAAGASGSVKSGGRKRKSFFGIPFGRSRQVAAVK